MQRGRPRCCHGLESRTAIGRCRICGVANTKRWRERYPDRSKAIYLAWRYRQILERLWGAWQALGELSDTRRTTFDTLSDESSAFAAIHQQAG